MNEIPGPLREAELETILGQVDDPPTDVRFRKRRIRPRYVAKGEHRELVIELQPPSRGGPISSKLKGLFTGDNPGTLATMQRVIETVAETTDVPAPTIVNAAHDPRDVSQPYLLMRRAAGESYDNDAMNRLDDATVTQLVTEAGKNLAAIHEGTEFEAFGDVKPTEETIEADGPEQWPQYLRADVMDTLEELRGGRFDDIVPDLRSFIEEHLESLDDSYTSHLHVSYRLGDLKIDETGEGPVTTAVGGWENAHAVDTRYSLMQAEETLINRRFASPNRRDKLRSRLHEGYEQVRSETDNEWDGPEEELYRLAARLEALAALPYWLDEAPEEIVQTRVNRHREFVQQFVDTDA